MHFWRKKESKIKTVLDQSLQSTAMPMHVYICCLWQAATGACSGLGCCLSSAYTALRPAVRIAPLARISPTAPASSALLARTLPSETTRRRAQAVLTRRGKPLMRGALPAQCARSRSLQLWSALLQTICSTPFLALTWCFNCLLCLCRHCIETGT